jgi:hypothetical protein
MFVFNMSEKSRITHIGLLTAADVHADVDYFGELRGFAVFYQLEGGCI